MDDDSAVGQVNEDNAEDDEWDVDERLLPAQLNGPARSALDWHLHRWQEGMRITPAAIIERAEIILRERPLMFGSEARPADRQAALDIIEAYDIMGYIEADRSDDAKPVVVGRRPIYERQSDGLRGEMIGRRYRAEKRIRAMREQEEQYGAALTAMGLSNDEDFDTLLAKLRPHGLELKMRPLWTIPDCWVLLWNPKTGTSFRGHGYSESEALCYAAAQAFLASAGDMQA
jgi:hypothetical protein